MFLGSLSLRETYMSIVILRLVPSAQVPLLIGFGYEANKPAKKDRKPLKDILFQHPRFGKLG